jgi:nucleoside phosphorylase
MQEAPTPLICEVVILTALGLEYKAVIEHLQDMKEITHQGTVYGYGNFTGHHRTWHVAVAEIGMGGPTAATETERAISYFRPQITLFVGIGGGLKDVKLGHVVAASKVYAYESGKVGQQFQPRPEAWRASHALEQRARAEARNGEWLTRLSGPSSDPVPEVHIGALAAGEKVLAATQSDLFRLLKATYGDTLAVEMEGHGFLAAVHANHSVHGLVVRGISDLIDGKSDADATGSQVVAARHAAAFAFHVLAKFTFPEEQSQTSPPPVVEVGGGRGESNSISPAKKPVLLTYRGLAAHLCDMASMTMVAFPYGDHRPAGRILEGRNEPREVAVAGFERLTDGLRNLTDSKSRTKSLSDMAIEFYEMVGWDLSQIQMVLTPRLLESATDQKLIDALMEFDHAHRTLYSAILGHKHIITQSAYSYIPDLIAAAGHLYREMLPHWERAEHDLAKDNGLADG